MRLENMYLLNVSCESLYTRERWDRFLRSAATTPLALILHVYNIDIISVQFSSLHYSMSRCAAAAVLTARCIYKRRLYVTVLFRDAVIDAIGHVLELPVAIVPTTFVHNILRGVRAYCRCTLQLTAVFVHFDRPFLPCLLLSRR